jgi:hypothetical protein
MKHRGDESGSVDEDRRCGLKEGQGGVERRCDAIFFFGSANTSRHSEAGSKSECDGYFSISSLATNSI